jgi:hypothetical protein
MLGGRLILWAMILFLVLLWLWLWLWLAFLVILSHVHVVRWKAIGLCPLLI